MKKSVLRDYAKLIVKMGVNVQKGQDVLITANVNDNYFVKYIVEEAYKAKARLVTVDWISDEVSNITYRKASIKALSEFPKWKEEKWQYQVDTLPARIYIDSSDPDALKGVNPAKVAQVRKATGPIVMKYREQMDNKYQWNIVGIPGEAWAKKVFPELSTKQAMNKLWDAIVKVTRLEGDPIENWQKHNAFLKEKTEKLNSLGIKKLIYKSNQSGTDFNVEIKKGMVFESGSAKTYSGVEYNPNMPTEECFTSPDKYSANGVVYASKPLSVMGKVVSDFGFRFENGKIVEVLSKKEDERKALEELISTDEGAKMLGEVALVPFTSPVNQTGLLFYSTLYDENACCHLAIGRAFEECIGDYQNKTEEEIKAFDLNKSVIHVDFMIGTADLDIKAITYDGKEVQIFKDGVWAI